MKRFSELIRHYFGGKEKVEKILVGSRCHFRVILKDGTRIYLAYKDVLSIINEEENR